MAIWRKLPEERPAGAKRRDEKHAFSPRPKSCSPRAVIRAPPPPPLPKPPVAEGQPSLLFQDQGSAVSAVDRAHPRRVAGLGRPDPARGRSSRCILSLHCLESRRIPAAAVCVKGFRERDPARSTSQRRLPQGSGASLVEAKARVINGWVKCGLMQPVEPRHLFFVIWAATQTYADFETQIRAVLGRDRIRQPITKTPPA